MNQDTSMVSMKEKYLSLIGFWGSPWIKWILEGSGEMIVPASPKLLQKKGAQQVNFFAGGGKVKIKLRYN